VHREPSFDSKNRNNHIAIDQTPDLVCSLFSEWLSTRDQIRDSVSTLSEQSHGVLPANHGSADEILFDSLDSIEQRLCDTKPAGLEGILCQIRWLLEALPFGQSNDHRELRLLTNMYELLDEIATEPRRTETNIDIAETNRP
jgi:hypothetical protein